MPFPEMKQPKVLPDGWQQVKLGEVSEVVGGSTPDAGNRDAAQAVFKL